MLMGLGIAYVIIRPTLVFGTGDLLPNNMAWVLRRFTVFPVYGNGDYAVQPVYAEDLVAQSAIPGLRLRRRPQGRRGPVRGHALTTGQ